MNRLTNQAIIKLCHDVQIGTGGMDYADALNRIAEELTLRVSEDEVELDLSQAVRLELFLSHACDGIYGDDGEMQCNHFIAPIDFKRDFPSEILGKSALHRLARVSEFQRRGEQETPQEAWKRGFESGVTSVYDAIIEPDDYTIRNGVKYFQVWVSNTTHDTPPYVAPPLPYQEENK